MPPLGVAVAAADVPPSRRRPPAAECARCGYAANRTVFGAILRGALPARVLYEDAVCLSFVDIHPASAHHYLVIPKRRIAHAGFLTPRDLPLVLHMTRVAELVAAANVLPASAVGDGAAARCAAVVAARRRGDVAFGFHRFPLLTVWHLHLHVLAPMPAKSWWYRLLHPRGHGRFFQSPEHVMAEFCSAPQPVDYHGAGVSARL